MIVVCFVKVKVVHKIGIIKSYNFSMEMQVISTIQRASMLDYVRVSGGEGQWSDGVH